MFVRSGVSNKTRRIFIGRVEAYEIEDRSGGSRNAAIRNLGDGCRYVRVTKHNMPFYTLIASEDGGDVIEDETR
jgi:hypothetical protein